MALFLLPGNLRDRIGRCVKCLFDGQRFLLVGHLHFFPFPLGQPGIKGDRRILSLERGREAPVLFRDEVLNLPLPLADDTDGNGLDTPRAEVLTFGRAPLFVVLAGGTRLPLVPPPEAPERLLGKPSPVVLQALLPEESIILEKSAYKIPPGQTTTIPIYLYNFGGKPVRGRLSTSVAFEPAKVTVPDPWSIELPSEVEIAPGERKELALRLTSISTNGLGTASIRITGEFESAARPVLSIRLVSAGK